MSDYYNDNDPFICRWLGELTAAGHLPAGCIDQRSIADIQPSDVAPYTQCHFFAGIGGWPLALKLAGWPSDQPVWTGSCPCQPFSCAGRGLGTNDPRHLWPEFFRLIKECQPPVIFGEQVASAAGISWLSQARADLETLGYAVGATGLCAYAVKAPHERLRAFWVAYAPSDGCQRLQLRLEPQVPKNRPLEALGAWNPTGSPFQQWEKLMAQSSISRVDDGVSSTLDIRPRLRAFGNAIVPQVAAVFIRAAVETIASI